MLSRDMFLVSTISRLHCLKAFRAGIHAEGQSGEVVDLVWTWFGNELVSKR